MVDQNNNKDWRGKGLGKVEGKGREVRGKGGRKEDEGNMSLGHMDKESVLYIEVSTFL